MNIVERAKACAAELRNWHETEMDPSFVEQMANNGADAIYELLALVERLGKFADGAIAVPGSIGYVMPRVTFDDGENGDPDGPWYAIEDCEPEALTVEVGAPYSYEDYMRASELYSTPGLAMQAAKRKAEAFNKASNRQAAEAARSSQ